MSDPTPWHQFFGIALTDLFTGRPWRVELEKELALKGQRLDVLIIERRPGLVADRAPARRRIFGSTRWPRAALPGCLIGSPPVPSVRGPVRVCTICAGAAAISA